MPLLVVVLLVCLALLAPATAQGASQYRIALIDPDAELLRAVSLSLEPWGVETAMVDAPLPEASQPAAVQSARALAQELGVQGVVWVTSAEAGSLLWVFDSEADEVTTRMLTETPPFDSAAAAAVALSVKTMLRPRVVEQPVEPPPEPTVTPERPPAPPAPPAPPPGPPPLAALEVGAGGRWVGYPPEPRLSAAVLAWPALQRRLGASVDVSTGPGRRIEDPRYRGRYQEIIAGAQARLRLLHSRSLSAAVAVGGALYWSRLEGTVVEGSLPRNVRRLNGSFDLDIALDARVTSGIYVGASARASYLPVYRRYFAEGDRLLASGPLGAGLGGHVGVELF